MVGSTYDGTVPWRRGRSFVDILWRWIVMWTVAPGSLHHVDALARERWCWVRRCRLQICAGLGHSVGSEPRVLVTINSADLVGVGSVLAPCGTLASVRACTPNAFATTASEAPARYCWVACLISASVSRRRTGFESRPIRSTRRCENYNACRVRWHFECPVIGPASACPARGTAEYLVVHGDTYAAEYACVPMWEDGDVSYRAP